MENLNLINLEDIKLPKDVIANSGDTIPLFGDINNEENTIVVITQLGRKVINAYVCTLSSELRKDIGECLVIRDLPGFDAIWMPRPDLNLKEFNGIKYTMACVADIGFDFPRANWLY